MEIFKTWGWLIGLVALTGLGLAALLLWQRTVPVVHKGKQRPFRMEDWPPSTTRPLTKGELHTFMFLRRALPECLLLPQIALARFLSVTQSRSYNQWFGSVGRRCVDFLVCSEQGDVLGVIALQSSKSVKQNSEGTQRKLKALEMAQIPIWSLNINDLPDAKALRSMVIPELQASHEHSAEQNEPQWQATRLEPHEVQREKSKVDASNRPGRWGQAWPKEEARSSDFLDEFGMIEMPPLEIKGSGRSATGFTRS